MCSGLRPAPSRSGRSGWRTAGGAGALGGDFGVRTPEIRETQGLGGTWVVARSLAAEPQPADHGAVAVDVIAHEVREQPPALPDQLEQAAARMVVVLVRAQMLGE